MIDRPWQVPCFTNSSCVAPDETHATHTDSFPRACHRCVGSFGANCYSALADNRLCSLEGRPIATSAPRNHRHPDSHIFRNTSITANGKSLKQFPATASRRIRHAQSSEFSPEWAKLSCHINPSARPLLHSRIGNVKPYDVGFCLVLTRKCH